MATGYSRSMLGGSDSFRGSFIEGSDEAYDFTCNPCEDRNNSIVEANFYCSVCHEFCCKTCNDVHNSFKANKKHKVYGSNQKDQWGHQTKSAMLPTEMCDDHPGEQLKMLCLNHQILCCSTCVALDHRACSDMAYVPKISNGIKQSQDLSMMDQTIDQFIKCVGEAVKFTKNNQTSLDESKKHYLDTFNNIRQQTIDLFNKFEKQALDEMDTFHTSESKDLQQNETALDEYNDNLTLLKLAIQPSSTKNESQLFVEMFKAHQQISEYKPKLQQLIKATQTGRFQLLMNPKLEEFLAITKTLGKLKVDKSAMQKKLPIPTPLSLLETPQTPPTTASAETTAIAQVRTPSQQQNQLYQATNGHDVNVKIPSDKYECGIIGSCQMPNGDFLLTDWTNTKVKRLNTTYNHVDYLGLPSSPRAICCLGDDKAVVTDYESTIHYLSITSNKMSITMSVETKHSCYGIAHHNGRLFVTDWSSKVFIYDTSCKLLKMVEPNNNGRNMLSHHNSRHIALSPDGNQIYVADKSKGLVAMNSDGNYLSTYNGDELVEAASGVCVDGNGRVLVCGKGSNNVLQLDEEGTRLVGEVVNDKDGIEYPRSICIDTHNSKLIVSMYDKYSIYNHIRVFDLNLIQ